MISCEMTALPWNFLIISHSNQANIAHSYTDLGFFFLNCNFVFHSQEYKLAINV